MFKLNPSENTILEVESNPTLDEKKKSRYLFVLGIILLVVAVFYRFASSQDFVLNAIFFGALLGSVLSFAFYFYKMYQANQQKGLKKYYITNTRVIEVDQDDNLVRDILRNKIKRVDVEYITGKSGDIIINPKELSREKLYKRELKGETDMKYSKDTFVIHSIKNANEVRDILK